MKICLSCGSSFKSLDWECPACHHKPKQKDGFLLFAPELAEFNTGFDPNHFSQLAKFEVKNFWFRARNRLLIWVLRRYFPNAKNFFEIGCGTGFVLSGIEKVSPDLALYGGEIFTTGLSFASDRLSRANLFQMDARRIPFDNEFDVIGCFDVLEHIDEDEMVLTRMFQALVKGGGIVITVPQHAFLWSQTDEYGHHVRRYSSHELKIKIRRAGFEVINTTSFVSLLLPIMIISRLKRQPPGEYDATSKFKISDLTNTILEKVLDIEHRLIRMGLSFPLGGSLLVIARKN